jgi:hypothetical protein
MPQYAPSAAEAFLLALIRHRESSNNYTATNLVSTASGAYQFIDGTWKAVATASGVGMAYVRAKDAPPVDQDFNALWLLLSNGPNSTYSWKASGPYPTLAECEFAMGFA